MDSLMALILGSALALGSPGPAPLSLAMVSSQFGLRSGVSYLAGVLSGLAVVTVAVGFGLFEVLSAYPNLLSVLNVLASVYMIYIGYKIAFADFSSQKNLNAPSYRDGFILNIANPKAYAAFFAIYTAFLLPLDNRSFAIFCTGLVGWSVGFVVDSLWTFLGLSLNGVGSPAVSSNLRKACGLTLLLLVVISYLI